MTGSGTEADPYIIQNVTDLQNIENDLSAYYELEGDIDASATSGWNAGAGFLPITSFGGELDGKGFAVSDLFIYRPNTWPVGLFALLSEGSGSPSTIQNLTLTNVGITGKDQVGALAGETFNNNNTVTIRDCHSSGSIVAAGSVGGGEGGLIGQIAGATISNCSSSCTLTYTGIDANANDRVGGFAGRINRGVISNCFATGSVDGDDYVGGFAGEIESLWAVTITNCYATGNVTGVDFVFGGFVGSFNGSNEILSIKKCYATGNVIGNDIVGGFSGNTTGGAAGCIIQDCYARGNVVGDWVGSFLGYDDGNAAYHTVDNCYGTGLVSETGAVFGGFVGRQAAPNDSITNCFWDTDTTGEASSDAGTGKTTSQMQTLATFTDAGWDFADIWNISPGQNNGYPSFYVMLTWKVGSFKVVQTRIQYVDAFGDERYIEGTLVA